MQNFDSLFAVDVRAPYFSSGSSCEPRLGSSPVLLASAAAHAAVTNLSVYAATKGVVETLVRHLPSSSASTAPVCGKAPCPAVRQ
jgi:3-oxoacyl-[acyl-carrier protein] reductase